MSRCMNCKKAMNKKRLTIPRAWFTCVSGRTPHNTAGGSKSEPDRNAVAREAGGHRTYSQRRAYKARIQAPRMLNTNMRRYPRRKGDANCCIFIQISDDPNKYLEGLFLLIE